MNKDLETLNASRKRDSLDQKGTRFTFLGSGYLQHCEEEFRAYLEGGGSQDTLLPNANFRSTSYATFEEHFELMPGILGKGGFGRVVHAKAKKHDLDDSSLENVNKSLFHHTRSIMPDVAVKIINKEKKHRKKLFDKFWKFFPRKADNVTKSWKHICTEINVLKAFSYTKGLHENIIQLHCHFEDEDKLYLVFELAQGGDLLDNVQRLEAAFSEGHVQLIISKILGALSFLHSKGVCHRDVKPSNIILRKELDFSSLVIADFGLATHTKVQGGIDVLFETECGSPLFVAPEVRTSLYNYKCDIWSVGVMTCLLLTGYMPHRPNVDPSESKLTVTAVNGVTTSGTVLVHPEAPGYDDFLRHGMVEPFKPQAYWDVVSKEARSFVARSVVPDSYERAGYKELLDHPWIVQKEVNEYYENTIEVEPLKRFHARLKAQKFGNISMALMGLGDLAGLE